MVDFTAKINKFVASSQERVDAVLKQSSQEIIEDMQRPVATEGGNMPVDLGFLRASIVPSIGSPVEGTTSPEDGGGRSQAQADAEVTLAIANLPPGESLHVAWTANYARAQHYGARGRTGHLWITKSAAKWQSIVSSVSARLKRQIQS